MIVTCPACDKQFQLPDGALGDSGRKLRCSACRHIWFEASASEASPESVAPVEAATDDVPPAAGADGADDTPPPPEDIAVAPAKVAAEPTPAPAPEAQGAVPEAGDETEETAVTPVGEAADAPEPEEQADDAGTETAAADDPEPAAPIAPAPTAWEPGAILPRTMQRDASGPTAAASSPQTTSLKLVAAAESGLGDSTGGATPDQAGATKPAAPSYDVTRVVAPDSAPRERQRKRPRRGRGLLLVVLLLIAIAAAAYVGRTEVMRYLPQSAALYGQLGLVGPPGSQGLQLNDVSFHMTGTEEAPVLVVSGRVINVGNEYRLLPELTAQLLDGDRRATVSWPFRAMADGLAPGDTTLFEARFPDPPRSFDNDYVFVTFADLS